ncbi:flagellar hook-length control protein [Kordiimonas sediminis]|uniref:Flagellar hook-length control protein n=1 Tax=Kordiimonas sediminis TaxID=1735581 RepID=A0A919E890_9PROT|nr:flagellar hook-length control protein FliK [Kordiimonas sediminis]GHF22645.1 flagellar hook-length control protein [Kordiimonas sediminis]
MTTLNTVLQMLASSGKPAAASQHTATAAGSNAENGKNFASILYAASDPSLVRTQHGQTTEDAIAAANAGRQSFDILKGSNFLPTADANLDTPGVDTDNLPVFIDKKSVFIGPFTVGDLNTLNASQENIDPDVQAVLSVIQQAMATANSDTPSDYQPEEGDSVDLAQIYTILSVDYTSSQDAAGSGSSNAAITAGTYGKEWSISSPETGPLSRDALKMLGIDVAGVTSANDADALLQQPVGQIKPLGPPQDYQELLAGRPPLPETASATAQTMRGHAGTVSSDTIRPEQAQSGQHTGNIPPTSEAGADGTVPDGDAFADEVQSDDLAHLKGMNSNRGAAPHDFNSDAIDDDMAMTPAPSLQAAARANTARQGTQIESGDTSASSADDASADMVQTAAASHNAGGKNAGQNSAGGSFAQTASNSNNAGAQTTTSQNSAFTVPAGDTGVHTSNAPATPVANTAGPDATPAQMPDRGTSQPDSNSPFAPTGAGIDTAKAAQEHAATRTMMGNRATPEFAQKIANDFGLQVTKAVQDGKQEFTMRMDPAELGRVTVKMQFENGKMTAKVMAERPETLEILQRDVRGLERAIESGGQKAENISIDFSLDHGNGESAGKAMAEAAQAEKFDEQLAKNAAMNSDDMNPATSPESLEDFVAQDIPLEEILAAVSVETGIDVRV